MNEACARALSEGTKPRRFARAMRHCAATALLAAARTVTVSVRATPLAPSSILARAEVALARVNPQPGQADVHVTVHRPLADSDLSWIYDEEGRDSASIIIASEGASPVAHPNRRNPCRASRSGRSYGEILSHDQPTAAFRCTSFTSRGRTATGCRVERHLGREGRSVPMRWPGEREHASQPHGPAMAIARQRE